MRTGLIHSIFRRSDADALLKGYTQESDCLPLLVQADLQIAVHKAILEAGQAGGLTGRTTSY